VKGLHTPLFAEPLPVSLSHSVPHSVRHSVLPCLPVWSVRLVWSGLVYSPICYPVVYTCTLVDCGKLEARKSQGNRLETQI